MRYVYPGTLRGTLKNFMFTLTTGSPSLAPITLDRARRVAVQILGVFRQSLLVPASLPHRGQVRGQVGDPLGVFFSPRRVRHLETLVIPIEVHFGDRAWELGPRGCQAPL